MLTLPSPLFLRARISIESNTHESALKILKVVFLILDKIVKVNLSAAATAKCEKIRRKLGNAKSQENEEEKNRKQEEKLR